MWVHFVLTCQCKSARNSDCLEMKVAVFYFLLSFSYPQWVPTPFFLFCPLSLYIYIYRSCSVSAPSTHLCVLPSYFVLSFISSSVVLVSHHRHKERWDEAQVWQHKLGWDLLPVNHSGAWTTSQTPWECALLSPFIREHVIAINFCLACPL